MPIATLRSFRIGPFTVFDFAIAYVAIYFLAPYLSRIFSYAHISVTRAQWLWLTLPIAVATHIVFQIDTPLTRMILDPSGHYIEKLVILAMLVIGVSHRPRALFR